MTTRRNLLLAAPCASVLATSAFGRSLTAKQPSPPVDQPLKSLMVKHLSDQLRDPASAASLGALLFSAGLDWRYPTMPVAQADSILAFSFGNRLRDGRSQEDATRLDDRDVFEPGPINAELADVIHAVRGKRPIPVYAQWEIAEILQARYRMTDVISISPERDANGNKVYLSTQGVAQAAIAKSSTGAALRKTLIVAHQDHVKRCVIVSNMSGIDGAAAKDVNLPDRYDAKSGQPWTRRRDLYLLTDVMAQLTIARTNLLDEGE